MNAARYRIAAGIRQTPHVPDVVIEGEAKGVAGTLVLFPSVFSGAE